jgi:glycosyltransferase involved in cell wall biosynthesis
MNPTTTVIVSAYDRPQHLERCLWSFTHQSDQNFNIVIADDGSKNETRNLIQNLQQKLPFDIKHVWQEDKGFRKSAILNKAVHHTNSDLLIFTDQDAVPCKDFVTVHKQTYHPNAFAPGGWRFLGIDLSNQLLLSVITEGQYENLIKSQSRYWSLKVGIYAFLQKLNFKSCPRLLGVNFSTSRTLFEKINGFDLIYEGWGPEDGDLAIRMQQSGGKKNKLIWTKAMVYHIHHLFDPTKPKTNRENAARHHRLKLLKKGILPWRCEHGFLEAIKEPYQVDGVWIHSSKTSETVLSG